MERIPRRHYTDDFKSQAVSLAGTVGPAEAARQLGISVKTLANWLDRKQAGSPLRSPSRQPVSELESDVARLRAENATLRMEREIQKKRRRSSVLRERVQVKYACIARQRALYPIRLLCRVLTVSVAGFYDHLCRHGQPRPDRDAALRADLHEIHAESRKIYGRPRLVRALRERAHRVGPKRVARLMREAGLRGKVKGAFKPRNTDSRHARPVADNLLARRFAVSCEVPAWVGDITHLETREGWLYLASVIDLRTRQVLGYSLADRMPDELVQRAFLNAWATAKPGKGILFHSDRGSQYASTAFQKILADLGFTASMSRKANCWDNAVAESFHATLKNEEATGVYATKAQAHAAIASDIHGFYNPTRLHSALGYRSPNDYARSLKADIAA